MSNSTFQTALPRDIVQSPKGPAVQGRLLLKGGTVITLDPHIGNLERGDVLIDGSRIVAIAPAIPAADAQVIDATDSIVMPGLVDTHRHAWEGQLRRIHPNAATLEDYCNASHFSFAHFYRPFDTYIGNLLTALGCLDAGITTIIDNSHNSRSPAHSDAALMALHDTGLRVLFAPGAPLDGEWDRASWPKDLERLQREHFSDGQGLLSLAMMSQLKRDEWAYARRLGIPIVTEFFGRAMAAELPALQRDGLLGPDNIFNHCTDLPDTGWEILREAGVNVNVCPRSDAQYGLADGIFGYQAARDHGLRPGLSVDNESSYSGDMFTEMRVAFFLQRALAQRQRHACAACAPAAVNVLDLLRAATVDGAACAGMSDRIGSLGIGKQADLLLIRTSDLNLYPSNHAIGTVVQAAERSNIDTVIVAGQIRKQGGRVLGVDTQKLRAATEASRGHLFAAAGYRPDPFAEFDLTPVTIGASS